MLLGFYTKKGTDYLRTGGHWVTVTGAAFNDNNNNMKFDAGDSLASISFIDPVGKDATSPALITTNDTLTTLTTPWGSSSAPTAQGVNEQLPTEAPVVHLEAIEFAPLYNADPAIQASCTSARPENRHLVQPRGIQTGQLYNRRGPHASAAARRAAASSALATPPCAADHATGSSRKRRTSASAASEK